MRATRATTTEFSFDIVRTGDTSGTSSVTVVVDQAFAQGTPADADDFVGDALPEPQEVTFEPGDEVKNCEDRGVR